MAESATSQIAAVGRLPGGGDWRLLLRMGWREAGGGARLGVLKQVGRRHRTHHPLHNACKLNETLDQLNPSRLGQCPNRRPARQMRVCFRRAVSWKTQQQPSRRLRLGIRKSSSAVRRVQGLFHFTVFYNKPGRC